MKKITLLMSIFAILALSFTGCKKDEASTGANTKETLTSKTWNFSKMETNSTIAEIKTLEAFMSAMMSGATFKFNADGTFAMTPVPGGLVDNETGTWTLADDNKTLTVTSGTENSVTVYTIASISSSELKFTQTDDLDYSAPDGSDAVEKGVLITWTLK